MLSMTVTQCTSNVQVSGSGGTSPYTYRLFDLDDNAYVAPSGLSAGSFSTVDAVINLSHNFEIEVRDDNGCFVREALDIYGASINIDSDLIRDTITHDLCFESPVNLGGGSIQPSMQAAITGGSGQYIYSWSTTVGSSTLNYNTQDIQNLLPGYYNLTVTDLILGCSETEGPFQILSTPPLVVTKSSVFESVNDIEQWQRPQTGSVSSSSSTNTIIQDMIILCPSEQLPFIEVTVTGAPIAGSPLLAPPFSVNHNTIWYRNGAQIASGSDRLSGPLQPDT